MKPIRIVFCLMLIGFVRPADSRAEEKEIWPSTVAQAPVIDGILNDAAWQKAPLNLGEWLTYNPLYGEKMAQQHRTPDKHKYHTGGP